MVYREFFIFSSLLLSKLHISFHIQIFIYIYTRIRRFFVVKTKATAVAFLREFIDLTKIDKFSLDCSRIDGNQLK
jgi:hypothetical protein